MRKILTILIIILLSSCDSGSCIKLSNINAANPGIPAECRTIVTSVSTNTYGGILNNDNCLTKCEPIKVKNLSCPNNSAEIAGIDIKCEMPGISEGQQAINRCILQYQPTSTNIKAQFGDNLEWNFNLRCKTVCSSFQLNYDENSFPTNNNCIINTTA